VNLPIALLQLLDRPSLGDHYAVLYAAIAPLSRYGLGRGKHNFPHWMAALDHQLEDESSTFGIYVEERREVEKIVLVCRQMNDIIDALQGTPEIVAVANVTNMELSVAWHIFRLAPWMNPRLQAIKDPDLIALPE
jgi:hypothetical protein